MTEREQWQEALPEEITFWEDYIGTRGGRWPEVFEDRMQPNRSFPDWIGQKVQVGANEVLRAIDVGCGPLTALGPVWNDRQVEIVAVDPLADEYNRIFAKNGLTPPIAPEHCEAELLVG